MPLEPGLGSANQGSELEYILKDMLAGMGDSVATEEGTLMWAEALVLARFYNALLNTGRLLTAQLEPVDATIYLQRWQNILLTYLPQPQLDFYISFLELQTNTPPTLSNVKSFLIEELGQLFLNIVWKFELQPSATRSPAEARSLGWQSPLSELLIYVWQPRDNMDNLLVSNAVYARDVDSYKIYLQNWLPAGVELITYNLINRGNEDGYAEGYNGLNYNNYLDGVNVVNGTLGSPIITGTDTKFLLYPDGSPGDFIGAVNEGYNPPIQIVDDTNTVRTYFVLSVQSNTQLTLIAPVFDNITNRTYRCLGFILDTQGVLDNGSLFNS